MLSSIVNENFAYLMTSANEIKIILVQKFSNLISSKGTRNTSITICPTINSSIRIRPKQITKETAIWNISRSLNFLNLIQILQLGREAPMHTKYLFINECSHRQTVEAVGEYLPKPNIKPPFTFIIKAINPIDLCIFMVSPQEVKVVRISYFVSQKQTYCFQTLLSTIYIISKKEVVCSRRESTVFK